MKAERDTYEGGVALRHASDRDELAACFPVIVQLRPQLESAEMWLEKARTMMVEGYRVLAAWRVNRVLALAGCRVTRNLIHGRFLYVDDLVVAVVERGGGLGAALLDELSAIGVAAGCACLRLDTAVANIDARRFYAREGLLNLAVGFVKPLVPIR